MHCDILFLRIIAENFDTLDMVKPNTAKKRLVTSFNNLTPELQEAVREFYPLGFTDAMMRIDKPNGDFFYAVPYETEEISYLVKIDVKIDDKAHEDDDKDYYDDDLKGADELQDEAEGVDMGVSTEDDVDI